MASQTLLTELAANGQIITQYADFDGNATMEMQHNPNGSDWAVEGIISPDGRVLGKIPNVSAADSIRTCRGASTCRCSHRQSSISNKQDKSAHNEIKDFYARFCPL